MHNFQALPVNRELLDAVFRSAPVGIAILRDRIFVEVNDFFCDLVGYKRQELIGRSARMVYPDDATFDQVALEKYVQISKTGSGLMETRFRCRNGALRKVYLSSAAIDPHNLSKGITCTVLDLTRIEQLELAEAVFNASIEGILITDPTGCIERVNPAFSKITGYSSYEAVGQNPRLLKSNHHDRTFYGNMWESLIKNGFWSGEIWNRRKDGESYPEHLTITAMKDVDGKTTHYVAMFYDLSAMKENEQQLLYQVNHDALTGLVNRKLCSDRLELLLLHAGIHREGLGILYIDLDNFKDVNDSLGHHVGDELLQAVAGRLSRCCREQDTVARMGGDEFMLLMPDLVHGVEDVLEAGNRIARRLSQPYSVGGHVVQVSASIGITLFPEDGSTPAELIKNADMAMYRAKEKGKNRCVLFTEDVNKEIQRRIMLENAMPKALSGDEYRLHYQPKSALVDGTITGFEALIRWRTKSGESIPPDEFIPLAERTGFILELSEWILATACRQLKIWHDEGFSHLTMAVNLSAREFENPGLIKLVDEILHCYNLKAEHLQLEITEHTLMEHMEGSIEVMTHLAEMGVSIAIDDFGTGFSSLAYLKKLPITTLKVDRTFVRDIPKNPDDVAIVRVVHSLSRALGLTMVAEGVETPEQIDLLREIGCDQVQGYLCSRPLPPEEINDFLRRNCPRQAQKG